MNNEIPIKIESVVPLKDQLKKKISPENNASHNLRKDPSREVVTPPAKLSSNPMPKLPQPSTLTDSDWTELLSTPKQPQTNSNGMSVIRGSRKDVKKLLEVKKNQTSRKDVLNKFKPRQQIESGNSVNGGAVSSKGSDGEESGSSDSVPRRSGSGSGSGKDESCVSGRDNVVGTGECIPHSGHESPTTEKVSILENYDGTIEKEKQFNGDNDGFIAKESDAVAESSVTHDFQKESFSASDEQSVSDSDSSSSSESENERKRREEREKRREQIRAEKAAAKAVEAIKERENVVARLEGEKQSLEKILEERAKQQAQEVILYGYVIDVDV